MVAQVLPSVVRALEVFKSLLGVVETWLNLLDVHLPGLGECTGLDGLFLTLYYTVSIELH